MKLIIIYIVFLINYIKTANYEHEVNMDPSINEGVKFYGSFRIDDGRYLYYTDSCLKINYPERNFSDFYLIFEYYIHKNSYGDDFNIKIFDKTFYGIRNKIVLKINTTSAFTIYINFEESYGSYELYFNFITGYSNFPYLYYYTSLSKNLTAFYCVNDEFRMFINISDIEERKKYYFYQSFSFTDKPLYKLFESFDSALNFNFKNFDGYLDIDDNKVMRFEKTNNIYNYLVLYFKGKETYEQYGPEIYELLFANLDNYEQFIFNPIIPVMFFLVTVILITALFYYLFQYEKKPKKPKEPEIKEADLVKELIPK